MFRLTIALILSSIVPILTFGQSCDGVIYFSVFDTSNEKLIPAPLDAEYNHSQLRAINSNCDSIHSITGIKISILEATGYEYSTCTRLQALSPTIWYFEQRIGCENPVLRLAIERKGTKMEIDFKALNGNNVYTLDSIPFKAGAYNLMVNSMNGKTYQLMSQ